jgi:serine protease Do
MSKLETKRLLQGAFITLLLTAAAGWVWKSEPHPAQQLASAVVTATARPTATTTPAVGPETVSTSFATLAKNVTPAVVNITVQKKAGSGGENMQIPAPFRQFFGNPQPQQQQEPEFAGGSGFIVSPDGYIVTNGHVVRDADHVTVTLRDGRTFTAKVRGVDPTTDIAVVKIDANNLPTLSFGSSEALQVGDWIMCVGNPGIGGGDQLNYTVTAGIVSAKGRGLQITRQSLENNPSYQQGNLADYAIDNFIQTDAVINPGNSGGPMVDMAGHVVGVNSAIVSTNGYYEGYGFAIPSDLVKHIADELIKTGHVERPLMGVQVQAVAPADAELYGLPSVSGALVQQVTKGGPADKAGLDQGDVIWAIDGVHVAQGGDLQQLIAEHQPGDVVDVTIYRNKATKDVKIKLGKANLPSNGSTPTTSSNLSVARLGMNVQDMDSQMANHYGWDSPGGAVVTDVQPWGPAGQRGVQPGEKIVELNGHKVRSASQFKRELSTVKSNDVASLKVESNDGTTRIVNLKVQ